MEIKWFFLVLNFVDWLKVFNFNIEFLVSECVGANIKWFIFFWLGVFIILCGLVVVFYFCDCYVVYCYEYIVLVICSVYDGEKMMFWIVRFGIFSSKERRIYAFESGD